MTSEARSRQHLLIWGAIALAILLGAIIALVIRRDREGNSPGGGTASTQATPRIDGMGMTSNGLVMLSPRQITQFGVTFGVVEVRTLTDEPRATGVVTFDETKLAQVAPKIGGYIDHLYVDATGQPVRLGQPLFDLYSPELVAAEQDLLNASHLQREIGRTTVPGVPPGTTDFIESAKRRLGLWDISDAQIEDVLKKGQVRRALTMYAPASGVVIEKKVVQGQSVAAGQQLYTIADLSDVWVDVQLREADAANVRTGSGADIELPGVPGRSVKGRVQYVYPVLDSAARTVRARVVVANTTGLLKPGMYATVRLHTPSRSALAIPNSAVLRTGDRNVVFVEMSNGTLMPQDVELGRTAGEYTEVVGGLEPGQRVVTSAQFLLDSESNLAEVMKAMMSQMSSGDLNNLKKTSGADMKDMPGMQMPAKR
jgi:membrane fusion protein, copper/silver efflux system